MKKNNLKNLRNQFEPSTRLAAAAAPARGVTEAELEKLKERLIAAELSATSTVGLEKTLRLAAEEAAALAWLTPYPLLLLPELLAETAAAARRKAVRQARIRRQSSGLLALAE